MKKSQQTSPIVAPSHSYLPPKAMTLLAFKTLTSLQEIPGKKPEEKLSIREKDIME